MLAWMKRHKAKLAFALGAVASLGCALVPAEYRAACDAAAQLVGTVTGGV